MPIINYATREVEFKLVYYGPPYAGKTTNLKSIHGRLSPETAPGIQTFNTGADHTLFFEFVPPQCALLEGFHTRLQLYAVPGTVTLNAPRQLVLREVDGIVFVADSQWSRMEENVLSLENLRDNLQRHGHALRNVPMVIQYNKQDLPDVASLDYMQFLLNRHSEPPRPFLRAVARRGENVLECLDSLTTLVLEEFRKTRPQEQPGRQFHLHENA